MLQDVRVREVETAEERWANFLAVRFIETHVGLTCTTEQWIEAATRSRDGTRACCMIALVKLEVSKLRPRRVSHEAVGNGM